MAQIQRIEGQVKIKCQADKFFNVWSRQTDIASKVCPDKVPNLKIQEGSWDKVGSKHVWSYVVNGEIVTLIAEVEDVDEKARSVSYKILEGQVMDYYKTLKSKIQVTPNGERSSSIVKWSVEYDKMTEDGFDPVDKNLELLLHCAKEIDARL